ncbi:ribonucleases P/MRP protein subunit POP1 [Orussus abietinus]|uniref:ribonucleases P/MRP protein subunit POP1 n=1 Tax=Orussus abietinus TaxID=222816 RepID=UPI0006258CD9|nr:ribonucleases P/MRP protein subunit POP1 [Orussus abietinus]
MDAEKKNFDVSLGGASELPYEARMMLMASARSNEIAAMSYSVDNPQQTKLVFQKLPIHMRRRVMSHNAKRLPRHLREAHIRQMSKSGLPPKTKRPSRKHRRRPRRLALEYKRRRANKRWLETHLWHAKRFHMVEKWGYVVPNHSNDKCFRASFRAMTRNCLIQDISYYTCLEIRGPEEAIKSTLKAHCNPYELSFSAKAYLTGKREGTVMFYAKNEYPKSSIGYVHFLWKCNDSLSKVIWIWVHPSFYNEFLKEIVKSFEFTMEEASQRCDAEVLEERVTAESIYRNNSSCEMSILKDSLSRFRLIGPNALCALRKVLKMPNLKAKLGTEKLMGNDLQDTAEKMDIDVQNSGKQLGNGLKCQSRVEDDSLDNDIRCKSWYDDYYHIEDNREAFKAQKTWFDTLKDLTSPDQLPSGIAVALTVIDPRFFSHPVKGRCLADSILRDKASVPSHPVSHGPIWDSSLREASANTVQTFDAYKLRGENLIPGVSNDDKYHEDVASKVPILIVQRPGRFTDNKSIGFGSGVDVILPSSWAIPFWMSFILHGCKPGGLRESSTLLFEGGNLNSPEMNSPDTSIYTSEALDTKSRLLKKYFRYPPDRRVNFSKFRVRSPFFCQWDVLAKEWSKSQDFYVLRNFALLSTLKELVSALKKTSRSSKKSKTGNSEDIAAELDGFFNKFPLDDTSCLVPVKLTTTRRGQPKNFGMICLPTEEDLTRLSGDFKWSGPVQKLTSDPNEKKRRTLRRIRLAELKRVKRAKARKRRSEEDSELIPEKKSLKRKLVESSRDAEEERLRKMEEMYFPSDDTVRYSCDREIMGFVTRGGFSFMEAKGVGLGYVTLSSLLRVIRLNCNFVLFRNVQTRQFRVAEVEVVNR